MPFVADLVKVQTTTDVATTTIVVPLPNLLAAGVAPKVLFAWTAGSVAPGDNPNSFSEPRDIAFSRGWAVSTSSRQAYAIGVDSGAASNADAAKTRDSTGILIIINSAGTIVGIMDVTDMSTVGECTLTIDDAFPSDYVFFLEAWGGTAITSATITAFNKDNTGPGTQDIATGNTPRYIEMMGGSYSVGATTGASATLSIGRCWVPTLANHVLAYNMVDNGVLTDSYSYGVASECHCILFGGSPGDRFAISAGSATGVTLNRIESSANVRQSHILSVAGTFSGATGTVSAGMDDGDPIPVTTGIAAKVHDVWSTCQLGSTPDTILNTASLSMGSAVVVGSAFQGAASFIDPDGVMPTTGAVGFSIIDLYQRLDTAGSIAASMQATGTDEYTPNIPESSNKFAMWMAFGDAAPVAPMGAAGMGSGRSWLSRNLHRGTA